MKHPKVSVLMNCYNSETYLKKAIDSIYAQTFQDFEIIFVDNCSTDSSALIAKSYDKRLVYVKTEKNISLYSARKYGLEHISGDYFAVLDCDDYWKEYKLESQLKIMESKSLDFIYGAFDLHFMTSSNREKIFYSFYKFFHFFKIFFRSSRFTTLGEQIISYNINLQTVLIKKSAIGNLTFSPKINLLGDYDFFLRFGLRNNKLFYYDKRIVSTTRIHPGQLSYRSQRNWYKEIRYLYLYIFKNKLNTNEDINFKRIINFFKSSYLWEKKEFKSSLEIKKSFRSESVTYFFHWLKFRIIKWRK